MIMDLVIWKQTDQKGLATSHRTGISLQPVFQQMISISIGVKADIQSISSGSAVKIILIATKYCFIA